MGANVMLFGWNRPIAGREKLSAQHFDEFTKYLSGLQQKGSIQSFEVVFLDAHGGDLNGFFLIKGDPQKLDALVGTTEWITHVTRATLHLEGCGAIRGATGDEIASRMAIWSGALPA